MATLYLSLNDFSNLLVCLPMSITAVVFAMTYIFFIVKTPNILVLLDTISEDFKQIEPFEEETRILHKSAKEGKFAVLVYIIYMATSMGGFYLISLMPPILDIILPLNHTRQKIYVLEVDYVLFDKSEYFTFVYLQTISLGTFCILTINTGDIMLYSLIQHACGMYRVLCYRLQNLINTKDDRRCECKMYETATDCVLMHNKILEYIEKLDSCFSLFLFLNYGCVVLLMSFQGVMIVLRSNDIELVMRYGTHYCGQIIHLLYNCIPGQKLKDHSVILTEYLYACQWYKMPARVKKMLLLMMIRSLRESKVTIGKFSALSLETYSMLLKTTFSYLSVLISVTK